MKNPLRSFSLCALALFTASVLCAQAPKIQFPRPSPTATFKQRVGATDIEITYSRPGVKGRQIFGGKDALVPFGEVWRTGANEATKVVFGTAVKFGGAEVAAGTYALFSIPDRNEWTVILNKASGDWGAYRYDQKNDVVRVKATPVTLGETVESFTIDLNDLRDESATLNLIWDRTRVPVKLETDLVPAITSQIDAAFAPDQKPSARDYDAAAMFYLDHNLDLAKAAKWIDAAIEQQPKGFFLHYHKARILAKQGDKAGARAAAAKSMELAASQGDAIKAEYTRLNQAVIDGLGQ